MIWKGAIFVCFWVSTRSGVLARVEEVEEVNGDIRRIEDLSAGVLRASRVHQPSACFSYWLFDGNPTALQQASS
jgi:hypothetical protein